MSTTTHSSALEGVCRGEVITYFSDCSLGAARGTTPYSGLTDYRPPTIIGADIRHFHHTARFPIVGYVKLPLKLTGSDATTTLFTRDFVVHLTRHE